MNVDDLRKIFQQLQNCLENVVGGSGHLACYSMIPDTFKITKVEPSSKNAQEYYFTAQAYLESEHEEGQKPESHEISGSIVLDEQFSLVRDDEGQVMLKPWKCMQPLERQPLLSTRDKAKRDLADKLARADEILGIVIEEMNFQREDLISKLIEEIQYRMKGLQTTSESGRIEYVELEDMYLNIIVGVMEQDQLSPDDEIKFLRESIRNRIEHFDVYFERLQKGLLKGPFTVE
ncbi:hypothetical protein JXB22_02680 [candidate division WOR-3 bacterium]|nr:hypothetical protein [candidate division WOR-3 bacterium]